MSSSNEDPPKRTESTEMTVVLPRAPLSSIPGPTIEQLADIERARRDAQEDIETLVACPGCAACQVCKGEHMISAERAAEYARQKAIEEEPPPEAA